MFVNSANIDTSQVERMFKTCVTNEVARLTRPKNGIEKVDNPFKHAEDVLKVIADQLDVTVEDLKSKKRDRPFSEARAIFFYIVCKSPNMEITYKKAGQIVGRDHATAIWGVKQCEIFKDNDANFQRKFLKCLNAYQNVFTCENEAIEVFNNCVRF